MTTHFFSDVIVRGKRSGLPRDMIVLALTVAAIGLAAWVFITTRTEAPTPQAPIIAAPLPVAPHAHPRIAAPTRPSGRSEADAAARVQPAEHARVEALPEMDPFEGVERVDSGELDGISQAH